MTAAPGREDVKVPEKRVDDADAVDQPDQHNFQVVAVDAAKPKPKQEMPIWWSNGALPCYS